MTAPIIIIFFAIVAIAITILLLRRRKMIGDLKILELVMRGGDLLTMEIVNHRIALFRQELNAVLKEGHLFDLTYWSKTNTYKGLRINYVNPNSIIGLGRIYPKEKALP